MFLALATVAVRIVPFGVLSRALGERRQARPPAGPATSTSALECRRAVNAATRRLPFQAGCLPRAIAGQTMLRLRGHEATVVFGLARDETTLLNHAWLEHDGQIVLGEAEIGYTPTVGYRA